MALDDDTRHSERNEQARQRAADQLRPAVRKLLAEVFEVDDDELPAVRDALKDVMRARRLRQERAEKTVSDVISKVVGYICTAVVGGALMLLGYKSGWGK